MITDNLSHDVKIPIASHHFNVKNVTLQGDLIVPKTAKSIVMFSHGSGSSRHSPRNRYVAENLQDQGFGTFLFDLLTEEEDEVYQNRFNIDLLTERLVGTTRWLFNQPELKDFSVGYFGASTGAGSALKAAAILQAEIKAVVSRGGRPDLAIPEIRNVKAPTLFIVGSLDYNVITLNEQAAFEMNATKKLVLVEGATHLFEEPGKLEKVSDLAAEWFKKYL